jgi:CRISPR-associated helicase Cas3/CRISPR-associated endonuclease Cas3-HD
MNGLSASIETYFLSHPKENDITLESHLAKVGEQARNLIKDTSFDNAASEASFYAGLLHDLGKLNPFYQQVFQADEKDRIDLEKSLLSEYERQHSIFSAWAAYKLLDNKIGIYPLTLALLCIAAHHSSLDNKIARISTGDRFAHTQQKILESMHVFIKLTSSHPHFASLDWALCLKEFAMPIDIQDYLRPQKNHYEKFLEAGAVFSSLIQADRGSFSHWETPHYDIRLDTSKLIRADTRLGDIRQQFHHMISNDHSPEFDVYTIHAPTGTGKTRIFLDLVERYVKAQALERVIYFSPLLALTEDFEEKIRSVVERSRMSDVLTYNHAFSGRLDKKLEGAIGSGANAAWNFENESFNSEFIITTTQRLLITLYSSSATDKMKLISFKNSLLIIDEVQTIPKVILSNLIQILKMLCKKMGTKVLLVSATIPDQLMRDIEVRKSIFPKELAEEYHAMTRKRIEFCEGVDGLPAPSGKSLFMLNTKRKALSMFEHLERYDPTYITTGIRKKDRSKLVQDIRGIGDCTVVSTQVLEAGVDVSFTKVCRELAPLDNIVQVMGRLNREGETGNPVLTVFKIDESPKPYSMLEVAESLKIIREVADSGELYDRLPGYYASVSEKNLLLKHEADTVDEMMRRMDFRAIWEFVSKNAFEEEHGEVVIVPDNEVQRAAIRDNLATVKKMDRSTYRKYSELSASLPGHPDKLGMHNMFDEMLAERGIWLPKQGEIGTVYDTKVGLDKWLRK